MDTFEFTRFFFQRALASIYLIAFINILCQWRPLLGEKGLLPVPQFLKYQRFKNTPSLFWLHYSDKFALFLAWCGLTLSVIALSTISERFGLLPSMLTWFILWLLYLSFVNVGQTFYSFGWESILLETGFLTIFFGDLSVEPPLVIIYLMRWILFRVMFGAGMIKLRGDPCWLNLTCMYYHYETQPMPNPLSWYFHNLPRWIHKGSVLYTHFIELIIPWGFFAPSPISEVCGLLTATLMAILILSGNLSWLNYLTIALCIPCFSDAYLYTGISLPPTEAIGPIYGGILALLTVGILLLSIRPTINLFSSRQMMNASFDSLHLVNTYGAFGSVGKTRDEVILLGSDDGENWKEYEFKGKPGNIYRCPPIIAPYHLRLDWLMWFAAMGSYRYHPWMIDVVSKLLQNDRHFLKLMSHNPFPDHPPRYIRADLYRYSFTKPEEKTKAWWKRGYINEYLPSLTLDCIK